LRIGDGPDEVNLRQIFKMETMPSWTIANSPYLAAHPACAEPLL
jgi:acyl-CoA dehydrogenase